MAVATTEGRLEAPRHLRAVNRILVDAAAHGGRHIAIQFPPRHGKSTLAVMYYSAWYLGRWPDRRVMLATHESSYAESWGGRVRDILAEHGDLFGVRVRPDVGARSEWEIDGRSGGMKTAGVGGSITGRGADLLICDDPLKNHEEAMSPVVRNAVWDWFRTTAYTRREPHATTLVIMTRWHPEDLIGRLTSPGWNENYADWTVISFPALAEPNDAAGRQPGEALWPERYPVTELESIRRAQGSAWFNALYQQDPRAVSGGTMFRREWFRVVEQAPVACRWCRCWDTAATEKKLAGDDPDWFAGALVGEHEGVWYIRDVRRIQGTSRAAELLVEQTARLDPPGTSIRMLAGRGDGGKRTIDHYARHILVGYDFGELPEATSKTLRAAPLAAAAEAGNVCLVAGAWVPAFLDEAEGFPNSAHDDQIDAASGAQSELAEARGVRVIGWV